VNPGWLSQLAPPHAPPPPGWWPPAPGWGGLVLLLVVGLAAWAWWWTRPHRRQRRLALEELKQLEVADLDAAQLAHRLQDLLRRYALVRHGRDVVAKLVGEAWLGFVITHGGKKWADEAGRGLLLAAYGGKSQPADRRLWLQGARGFIRGGK
jgi:Domain of unknown function (DUF4381)